MRKNFIFLRYSIAFFLSILFISASAQDWVTQSSKLYYFGSKGKVQLEPDFNAMAVYFENDEVSEEASQKFKAKFSLKSTGTEDFDVMDRKGVIRIKSVSSLQSIKTPEERADFLKSENLSGLGAYEVLPAFKVGGKQVWFTKRVTIRLKEGISLEDISDVLEKYDAVFIKNITNADTYLLRVNKIQNQLPLIQELGNKGLLKWGQPDFKVDLVRSTNDPMYPDSWHLNNTGGSIDGKALVADIDVNAPEAWTITTGVSSVVVAVIDDGLEAHEDMSTLLPGYTPANGGNGTPSLSDDGHGQQVAGLIGAQHNNIGAAGIAPGVSIFSVNIFNSNTTNADVADGIAWAVDHGADVLSNSWGFSSCTYNDAGITDAFAYAATNGRGGLGCIILIASGNDFQTCVGYPANLSIVTAVGGISGDGQRSMYSNYGSALDIVAPSDDDWQQVGGSWYPTGTHGLRTIDRMGSAGWYSGNYSVAMGGTSGATPQVSAVAALVLSVNPSLTKSEVENILYTTAKDMGNANELGAGIVDAHAAVLAAGGASDNEAPTVPTGLAASNIGGTSFDISWNASSDNVAVTGYNIYVDGTNVSNTAGTSTTVNGLSPNTAYSVRVSAYDAAGNESAQSSAINVSTTEATISCSETVSSFPYAESFESNDGWTQITGDDGNWVRDANGTPSSNTGPSSAVDGSYYMFLEASTNGSTGQIGPNATAILESACFDLTAATEATFSFQYHMYGTAIGSLAIQVSVDGLNWTNLWSLSGDQGNSWYPVDVDLNDYAGATVKLRIVGTTGSSWSSDIAVDDLQVTTGGGPDTEAPSVPTGLAASNTTQTTTNLNWNASTDNVGVTEYEVYVDGSLDGTTASTSYSVSGLTASTVYSIGVLAKDAAGNSSSQATINVTTLDPVGGGCEGGITAYPYSQGFEGSIGDWTQDASDDLNWTVDANGTPSSSTGPSSADEGTYYIYIESSTSGVGFPNKVAILNSPCYDLTGETNASFNFSYHMYGSAMGTLELQASTDGTNWTNLLSLSGNQGNEWNDVAIDLAAYVGGSVQLRYVGTTGTSYTSDMAIDNISLTTGSTPTLTDLSLTITFDNYPEETSWTLVNSGGTTVASGGTYGSQADGSTLVIPINGLPNDCYDFTILDSYGDGICCTYGNGSYTLETTGGTLLASGGSFAYSELTNFCLNGTSFNKLTTIQDKTTHEFMQKSFNVYPNPAKEVLNINAVNFNENAIIRITDVAGAVIYMTSLNEMNSKSLDISEFKPGLYFISISDDKKSSKNKLKFIKQ